MSMAVIGAVIAALRRERGIKQEELARFVGVSVQAVSKWENGGVPDTELLPKIADFFCVPLDRLFGRQITDYADREGALAKRIADAPPEGRIEVLYRLCWVMERALFGENNPREMTIEDIRRETAGGPASYSAYLSDNGFTFMSLAENRPYFLLVPESPDKKAGLFDVAYAPLFQDLADQDVLDSLLFLYTREENKGFTVNLLTKKLHLQPDKAAAVVETIKRYGMIHTTSVELDDASQEIHTLLPQPALAALLLFAHDLLQTPHHFYYYSGNRTAPYLA